MPTYLQHCCTPHLQDEVPDVKVSRRMALIKQGAVPALMALIAYAPKMPAPPTVPMPLAGKKKPPKDGKLTPPYGQKDNVATMAAACLRFLALCPGFVEDMTGRCNAALVLLGVCAQGRGRDPWGGKDAIQKGI